MSSQASQSQSAPEATPSGPAELDFTTFLISLGTSGFYHLGATLPGGEQGSVNLPLARDSIDTLCMLKRKTEGNRTAQETQLLETLLYDLRLRFVEVSREHASEPHKS